jgi:flagellar biosynthetic protein FlhB
VMENKPLAQVLYRTVDMGQTIPSTLYQVVADLLAHVYRMKNKAL